VIVCTSFPSETHRHKSLEPRVVRNAEDKETSRVEEIRQIGRLRGGAERVRVCSSTQPADDGIEVAESSKVGPFDIADELLIGILVPRECLGIKVDRDEVRRWGMSR
jgi:hypothetical protein